ncbi:hypothetical protein [Porphyromonas circumdentaria]|uniref:hypothetical protein n=1 Tax=Porphyromonas circumdentaria TaxID=29524 RepID=UPI0026DC5F81|nr:hypothetical protein [Porphyromonas circumdentaria]MDO4721769.1 hypothetical protein [Porphyromonas circumdentaria]
MKQRIFFLIILLIPHFFKAYSQSSVDKNFDLRGSLLLDDRINITNGKLNWQEYRISLLPVYKINEKSKLFSDIWIRKLTPSSPFNHTTESVQIREAYIDLYGFLLKNLDLRIGRQRIAWGTADRLNPSDNINPWELEDFWDFGRHTPSNSIQAKYYWKKFTIIGVFTPKFTPSILPDQSWTKAFTPGLPEMWELPLPDGKLTKIILEPHSLTQTNQYPKETLATSTYALKVATTFGKYSVSAGFVHQYSPLPLLTNLAINGVLETLSTDFDIPNKVTATVNATQSYALRDIISLDFSGSIKDIGVWGETALFVPYQSEKLSYLITVKTPLGTLSPKVPDKIISSSTPFLKYTLGFDYTFTKNIYLNFQYVHGFFHEGSKDNLTDWIVLNSEWKSENDRLKVALLNAAYQVTDWKNIGNSSTLFWMPEITYKPIDNVEIKAGIHHIWAGIQSPFFSSRNNSDAYFKMKYSF